MNRIYEWARAQPEKAALIHNDRPISYAVFARAIEATRRFLDRQNLPAGQTAVILARNLVHDWLAVMALRALGLNTICTASLKDAEALKVPNVACIVVPQHEQTTHNLKGGTLAGTRIVVIPAAIYAQIKAGDIPQPAQDAPPVGGHILYTSGTTGFYKKILRASAVEDKGNALRASIYPCDGNTVFYGANFPLWTSVGFDVPSAVWHVGGSMVLNQRPDKLLNWSMHGVTFAFLVPPMLKKMLEAPGIADLSVKEFDLGVGGGFVPLDLAERAVDRLTKIVTVRYGATEYSALMRTRFKDKDDLHWLEPVGAGMFQIVDESGNECPVGQEGELRVVLTDVDSTSYLEDEEASRKAFRAGYFYPGDMAVRRADGRIRILGRTSDVLNLQGLKRAVAPMEQRIQQVLGVDAVCLFSRLDDEGEEELVVAIEAEQTPAQSELDKVAQEFRSFERVRFETFKLFPRTEAGMQKINRIELRKLVF